MADQDIHLTDVGRILLGRVPASFVVEVVIRGPDQSRIAEIRIR